MAQRYEVTNLTRGPKGFHEVGKAEPTIIGRGATETLVVEGDIERILHAMADKNPPQVELNDLGPAEGKKASAPPAKPAATDPKKPAETPPAPPPGPDANAKPGEYQPSMDFENLEDDQLRGFLKAAEVNVHPATGRPKLIAKALETDRKQWDEAQKPKPESEAI